MSLLGMGFVPGKQMTPSPRLSADRLQRQKALGGMSFLGTSVTRKPFVLQGLRANRLHYQQAQVVAFRDNAVAEPIAQGTVAAPSSFLRRVDAVQYRFIVKEHQVQFGHCLKVVGSLPELGAWQVSVAPSMQWTENHNWILQLNLPPTSFTFKIVQTDGTNVKWEKGGDRTVEVSLPEDTHLPADLSLTTYLSIRFNAEDSHLPLVLAVPRGSVEDALQRKRSALAAAQARARGLATQEEQLAASVADLEALLAASGEDTQQGGLMASREAFGDHSHDADLAVSLPALSLPPALQALGLPEAPAAHPQLPDWEDDAPPPAPALAADAGSPLPAHDAASLPAALAPANGAVRDTHIDNTSISVTSASHLPTAASSSSGGSSGGSGSLPSPLTPLDPGPISHDLFGNVPAAPGAPPAPHVPAAEAALQLTASLGEVPLPSAQQLSQLAAAAAATATAAAAAAPAALEHHVSVGEELQAVSAPGTQPETLRETLSVPLNAVPAAAAASQPESVSLPAPEGGPKMVPTSTPWMDGSGAASVELDLGSGAVGLKLDSPAPAEYSEPMPQARPEDATPPAAAGAAAAAALPAAHLAALQGLRDADVALAQEAVALAPAAPATAAAAAATTKLEPSNLEFSETDALTAENGTMQAVVAEAPQVQATHVPSAAPGGDAAALLLEEAVYDAGAAGLGEEARAALPCGQDLSDYGRDPDTESDEESVAPTGRVAYQPLARAMHSGGLPSQRHAPTSPAQPPAHASQPATPASAVAPAAGLHGLHTRVEDHAAGAVAQAHADPHLATHERVPMGDVVAERKAGGAARAARSDEAMVAVPAAPAPMELMDMDGGVVLPLGVADSLSDRGAAATPTALAAAAVLGAAMPAAVGAAVEAAAAPRPVPGPKPAPQVSPEARQQQQLAAADVMDMPAPEVDMQALSAALAAADLPLAEALLPASQPGSSTGGQPLPSTPSAAVEDVPEASKEGAAEAMGSSSASVVDGMVMVLLVVASAALVVVVVPMLLGYELPLAAYFAPTKPSS